MMQRTILAPVLALMLLGTFAACSSNNDTVGQQNTGGAGGGGIQIGPGVDCTNGPNFTDCPCSAGETKACYTGPVATRGVGACHDGVQTCSEHQELHFTFGACTGEALPSATNGSCVAESGSGTGTGGGQSSGCAPGECDPSIAAPRPISPTSTGRVSSWRPTLRWELAPGADGARVTLCHDRACASIISILDATGTSVKVSADLSPGVVYWTLTGRSGAERGTTSGPVWQFVVGHKSAPADTSWGTMFDANGDGYADLLVGAKGQGPPIFPAGQGRVYVYQGAPAGVPAKPTTTLSAPADAAYFGWRVASAGDVNGDGYADAIVGTNGALPSCGGGNPGFSPDQAWIYFGGPNGLGATPGVTLKGPNAGAGTCGVACTTVDCGSFNPACMADCDYFGSYVAPGGDINGDGYADVLVGASLGNAAYVYYGSASGVTANPTKLTGGNSFGTNIAGIGDVNGDGFADVGVGSGSSIVLFLGSAGGLITAPIALLPGSKGPASPSGGILHRGIDCAGDVNGDGYADVVTTTNGGNTNDPMGVPGYVYYGGPGGVTAAPAEVWSGGGSSSTWLQNTAGGGDLNGDGYSDVLWGGSLFKEHLGSASGIQASFSAEIMKAATVVLGAGDLNGDGFDDAVSETTIYYGTATGIVPGPSQVLSAPVGDFIDQSGFGGIIGGSTGL